MTSEKSEDTLELDAAEVSEMVSAAWQRIKGLDHTVQMSFLALLVEIWMFETIPNDKWDALLEAFCRLLRKGLPLTAANLEAARNRQRKG